MPRSSWSADAARGVLGRLVVEGNLVLLSPAHFGNGDGDDLTDMPLLLDPTDERTPLLTGASLAGALRAHLRSRELGHHAPDDREKERRSDAVLLFGGLRGDDEGEQSPLIVDDARGRAGSFGVERRDGVRLRPASRTAEEDKLFDFELWHAGTLFPLRLELLLREGDDAGRLKRALADALAGLSSGAITLGARKRRGFGRVTVEGWRVRFYDLTTTDGLLGWLEEGGEELPADAARDDLHQALGVSAGPDARKEFRLRAEFSLNGSLLIRSGGGRDDPGPDMVHLHSPRADGTDVPVLSGTSLAGGLRARARRITASLGAAEGANRLVAAVFGPEEIQPGKGWAGRLFVEETVLEGARTDLVQNRVSIDRFTGGARETALFNQQPAFGGDGSHLVVSVRLLAPRPEEVGLLLLLLKDLWTGDLALGGESGVGRGRLRGLSATLEAREDGQPQAWKLAAQGERVGVEGDRAALEGYVAALTRHLRGEGT